MPAPLHLTLLACAACVLWSSAGVKLLLESARTQARPDYLAALGLLLGGIVIGLAPAAFAQDATYPGPAILLGGALLWSFGTGQGDEATALQRGDRWLPLLVLAALAVLVQSLYDLLGEAPSLSVGLRLHPLQLPAALLLLYLWRQAGTRPPAFFQSLGSRATRELLFATAAACIANTLSHPLSEICAFAFLCLGPAVFLVPSWRREPLLVSRVVAMATASLLGFHAIATTRHLQEHQRILQSTLADAGALTLDHAWLQYPVDTAVNEWVHDEADVVYERMHRDLDLRLSRLHAVAQSNGRSDLLRACSNLSAAMASHARWTRDTFQSVALRRAAWGDEQAVAHAESKARSAHRESQLAHQRGRLALQAILQTVGDDLQDLGSELASARSASCSLLVLLGILGFAVLRREPQRTAAAPSAPTPAEPAGPQGLLPPEQNAAAPARAAPLPPSFELLLEASRNAANDAD